MTASSLSLSRSEKSRLRSQKKKKNERLMKMNLSLSCFGHPEIIVVTDAGILTGAPANAQERQPHERHQPPDGTATTTLVNNRNMEKKLTDENTKALSWQCIKRRA